MSMTAEEKLTMVKSILCIEAESATEDGLLNAYLNMAEREILGWRYSNANPEAIPEIVPDEYEMTQIMAVVTSYTQSGNEGQSLSIENGIHRSFRYSSMVDFIRNNVIPIAGVPRSKSTQEDSTIDEPTADDTADPIDDSEQDGEP